MDLILSLLPRRARSEHRAVFAAFAEGLARMLKPTAGRARVRAVGG
ncbi:MAG TPA: hypothetical protein VFB16_07710 [Bauldia sp.]|nr:hypothetical protein [Bauldia sp.]